MATKSGSIGWTVRAGPMLVVAVPSASYSALGRAGWNQYRISGDAGRWRLEIETRRTTAGGFATTIRRNGDVGRGDQPRNRAHVSLTSRQSSIESTSTAASACARSTGAMRHCVRRLELRQRVCERQASGEIAQEQADAEHPHDAPRPFALLLDVAPEDRDRVSGRLQHREQVAAAVGVVAEVPTGAAGARKRRQHVGAAREADREVGTGLRARRCRTGRGSPA